MRHLLTALAALTLFVSGAASRPPVELVYVWSAAMPLSVAGVNEIRAAGVSMGMPVRVVDAESLYSTKSQAAVDMVAAGATVHFPSLIIYQNGQRVGDAILGYKKAAAYQAMVRQKLSRIETMQAAEPNGGGAAGTQSLDTWRPSASQDFPIEGRPAPYFKVVPGTDWLVWARDNKVFMMDFKSGARKMAPGYIDFIPSPDGRIFVTPGRDALDFYDARQILAPTSALPKAFYSDPALPDQYPSVGILESSADGQVLKYRILTSWFAGVAYRDYEVDYRPRNGPAIRPLGPKVNPCGGMRVSIPILSKDGREMGARDEDTATTKIYRIGDKGDCKEVLDLRLQTGKITFGPDGRRITFAIPTGVRNSRARPPTPSFDTAGVFVLDRNSGRLAKIDPSGDANRAAFPDFVGQDRIMYLTGGPNLDARFRLVCCLGN